MDKFLGKILEKESLSNVTYKLLGHYVTVFMLHRPANHNQYINGHCINLIEKCLKFSIKKGFNFATPDELILLAKNGHQPKRPTICFTIDDGYADEVESLCPLFIKYSIQPTIFVITDFIDQQDWPWDAKISYMFENVTNKVFEFTFEHDKINLDLSTPETLKKSRRAIVSYAKSLKAHKIINLMNNLAEQLAISLPSKAPDRFKPASWSDLRHLEKKGLVVGSHGRNHFTLNSIDDQQIARELNFSKKKLHENLKSSSQVFCYPSGTARDFSPHHTKLVKEAGHIGAMTAKPGNTTMTQINNSPYTIRRHALPDSYEMFVRYVSWFEALRTRLSNQP